MQVLAGTVYVLIKKIHESRFFNLQLYLIGRRSIRTRGGRGGMSCQEQRVTTASTASRTRSSTTQQEQQQEQQQERASSSEGEESGEEE